MLGKQRVKCPLTTFPSTSPERSKAAGSLPWRRVKAIVVNAEVWCRSVAMGRGGAAACRNDAIQELSGIHLSCLGGGEGNEIPEVRAGLRGCCFVF